MKIIITSILFCFSSLFVVAQPTCSSPMNLGNNSCGTACRVCDLDGFTATVGMNPMGSLPPGFCGSANFNSSWFRFRAQSTSLSILIQVADTSFAPLQAIGIYSTTGICSGFNLVSACEQNIGPNQSRILTANNLSAGVDYFLVALAEPTAISDFSVEVLSGNTLWPAPATPQITAQGPFCPVGTFPFLVTPVDNATYDWTVNGQHVATGVNANLMMPTSGSNVEVCVTASNACASSPTVCQNYPLIPLPPINLGTITICQGEVFQYGGLQFFTPGPYNVTTKAANGCQQPTVFFLQVLPSPSVFLVAQICEGESYQIGTNEYTQTGVYTEVLTTFLGCDSTVMVNLTVLPNTQTVVFDTICPGGVYHFGGNTYTQAGQYDFQHTSVNGCDSTVQLNLAISSMLAPMVHISGDTSFCQGDVVSLEVNGAGDVLWSTGDTATAIVINPVSDTLISVTALDSAGCIGADSILVVAAPPVQTPTLTCQNATTNALEVLLELPAGYAIDSIQSSSPGQLNGDIYQVAGLLPGDTLTLEVRALSPEGCLAIATVGCATLDCPVGTVAIDAPAQLQCTDGGSPFTLTYSFSGAGAPTSVWTGPGIVDPQAGTFDPLSAGIGDHQVILTLEEAGCSYSAQTIITVDAGEFPPAILPEALSLCYGEDVDICLPSGYAYQWTGPNGFVSASSCLTQLDLDSEAGGEYTVVATSPQGCVLENTINLDLAPEVQVSNFPENQTVCPNQIVGFSPAIENAIYYRWHPSAGLSCPTCLTTLASVRRTTTYTLVALDANGCVYYFPVTLTIDPGFCGGILVSSGLAQFDNPIEQQIKPQQPAENVDVALYPNPVQAGEVVNIYLQASTSPYVIHLRDVHGRIYHTVEQIARSSDYYPFGIPMHSPAGYTYVQVLNQETGVMAIPVMVVDR
ncbi:MAG: hypothetical protein HUU34_18555 [Saprospiraceae bacterium]|nr:hypothetical protein [Saprospiraceae bacterium]